MLIYGVHDMEVHADQPVAQRVPEEEDVGSCGGAGDALAIASGIRCG